MSGPRVKICGLTRRADAAAAAELGAACGGVILAPGRSRSLDVPAAASVLAGLPLRRVGVFVDAPEDEVLRAAERISLDVVQLHGEESPGRAAALRRAGLTVWKALHPRSPAELTEGIDRYAGAVDGLLLDGWSAHARGGAGASFDWEGVAARRGSVPPELELIVAGGLNPGNVARAAALLRPTTVDVSSGVESERGRKDHGLIRAFVAAAASTAESR